MCVSVCVCVGGGGGLVAGRQLGGDGGTKGSCDSHKLNKSRLA